MNPRSYSDRGETGWAIGCLRHPAVAIVLVLIMSRSEGRAQWTLQDSGTKARLRGLSVVDAQTAWATGSAGTVLRTTDGGLRWVQRPVPAAPQDDFRDVHALGESIALVLAVGPGQRSKVLSTRDGGETWRVALTNADDRGFFDAIAFWDQGHGLLQGDPVEGRFVIHSTLDGGASWTRPEGLALPPAPSGEGAFAASGTSLVVEGTRNAWFGTGGGAVSRVFRTVDGGISWQVAETPVQAGTASAGVFSLSFRDPLHGVAVGGDFKKPDEGGKVCARTADGGRTWTLPKGPAPRAYRSAVAYVPGTSPPAAIAVGPSGTDVSLDDGDSWKPLGSLGFHALGFSCGGVGWAVGEDGRIARFIGISTR